MCVYQDSCVSVSPSVCAGLWPAVCSLSVTSSAACHYSVLRLSPGFVSLSVLLFVIAMWIFLQHLQGGKRDTNPSSLTSKGHGGQRPLYQEPVTPVWRKGGIHWLRHSILSPWQLEVVWFLLYKQEFSVQLSFSEWKIGCFILIIIVFIMWLLFEGNSSDVSLMAFIVEFCMTFTLFTCLLVSILIVLFLV